VVVVLIVLAASAGVVGTGVVEQGRIMSHQEAEQWSWKAEKCLKDEDYKGAVEAYTQAIALHPTVRSYLSRSFAHAELGLLQESLDDCQKAVALDPTNQAAVRTLDRAKSDLADR
jgi:tetratricopeptide (TPR) repeat protein